jgi:lipoate-protein ligase A
MGIAEVVVGSLMFTFDKATMARVLRVSTEKMRDKVFQGLEQYMTTMQEQLPALPERELVKRLYVERCANALEAGIVRGQLTPSEQAMMAEWDARFLSDEWLHAVGGLHQARIKIHEDVRVGEAAYKAPGGLIRVTVLLREGLIDDLSLSGDFTLLPGSALGVLERSLRGAAVAQEALESQATQVYRSLGIQSPGVSPSHFVEAILAAVTV